MHCQWRGGSLYGVQGNPVRVEVQMARGLPGLSLVGLAGAAMRESRERVLGALRESGYQIPLGRVTVNLAPAEEPKEGTACDLPMALGLLEVSGQIRPRRGRDWWILGELGLDGSLLPVRGALAIALAAEESGAPGLILPAANAPEARLLEGIELALAGSLQEAVAWVEGREECRPPSMSPEPETALPRRGAMDLSAVEGLPRVRRALAVAAAGGHNLLLVGAPGNGKSLMSRLLADLLPPLADAERREVMAIRSVAGLSMEDPRRRPFRAPHHSVSCAGFLGAVGRGGRPGEITLAHRGLLFMDELPEFNRAVREALREPLEDGELIMSRGAGRVRWPARFQLVAAMNPCPCGQSLRGSEHCRCTPGQMRAYTGRISGPLLDRMDLIVEVPPWRSQAVRVPGESTATMRRRVKDARRRLRTSPPELPVAQARWLDDQLQRGNASYRLRDKLRRCAGTLAALDGADPVRRQDLLEAMEFGLQLRSRLEGSSPCRST